MQAATMSAVGLLQSGASFSEAASPSNGAASSSSVHPQEVNPHVPNHSALLGCHYVSGAAQDQLTPHPASDVAFRHSGWLPLRRKVAAVLVECTTTTKAIQRFCACGKNAWVVHPAGNDNDFRLVADYCHNRWCVPCAGLKARVIASNLADAAERLPVRFLTLTLKGSDAPLSETLDRLYRCFTLLRRRTSWVRHVRGGAVFLEVTFSAKSGTWHPHLHVLFHGGYFPQRLLKGEWYAVTGDSYVVDVRAVRSRDHLMRYVTKYVSKPIGSSVAHDLALLRELIDALSRRRVCSTFGSWRGIKLTETPDAKEWVFVTPLATLRRKAAQGDLEALRVFSILSHGRPWIVPPPESLPLPECPPDACGVGLASSGTSFEA